MTRGLTRLARGLTAVLLVVILGVGGGAALALARSHHRKTGQARCNSRSRHQRRARRRRCSARKRTTRRSAPKAHGQGVSTTSSAGSAATNQSNNWSGYNQGTLEQGGTLFHSISAQWKVPTASQHTSGEAEYSSDWIGIGGGCIDSGCAFTDPTLIQTGTEQDVNSNGSTAYSAWWEVIPGPSLPVSMSVHPGDQMSASIAETIPNSEVWTITLNDLSDGQSFSTTVPYTSTHATAEWIQETPLILTGAAFAALPNLTSPQFDHATVNGAPANLKPSEEIQLIDSNRNVIGTPSSPDPDTDGFNVCTWTGGCSVPSSS